MFTGMIEEIGMVQSVVKTAKTAQISIGAKKILEDISVGDSISTNGVCLTVSAFNPHSFSADVMPETMRRSNLKGLRKGSPVNLERALRVGDRLGGHMVSGHIDGVGIIRAFEKEDNATWVTIQAADAILRYVIPKGSVAIDGISLTAAYADKRMFKVSIIPLTQRETTLLEKKVGHEVNLECDPVGKYVEKLLSSQPETENSSYVNMGFLKENGFL
ncbi:MAG: riboflavin synthase [Firmicutes bacterium]|nr:riboflavin synthase [Bacillota bacterium]